MPFFLFLELGSCNEDQMKKMLMFKIEMSLEGLLSINWLIG